VDCSIEKINKLFHLVEIVAGGEMSWRTLY